MTTALVQHGIMRYEDIIEREIEVNVDGVMYNVIVTRIIKCDRTDFIMVNADDKTSFTKHNVQFHNNYILPFTYDGMKMDCVTRAFWHTIYKLVGDTETCATIMKFKSPSEILKYVPSKYPVEGTKNMETFRNNTLRIMYSVQVAKFKDQKVLISALAFTGTIPILALCGGDEFYGCIFNEKGEVKGQNELGNILMKVRDLFRYQSFFPEVNMSGRFE